MKNLEAQEQAYRQSQQKQKFDEDENEAAKRLGIDLSGIHDPKIRQQAIALTLQGQNQANTQNIKYKNKAEEDAAKLAGEQKVQKEMMSFADRLEAQDPKFKGVADIYRLDIPLDQKTKIVQSITGTDVYREDQQRRLQFDSTLKRYNSRLKELDSEISNVKNPNSTGKAEADALRKQRIALRNERDQLLDFKALSGYEDDEEAEAEETGRKVKFNPSNKEHRAKAEQLYKKFKDKEKVRQALLKEFKGL